ncbi:MAG TPA: hypothetical protein VFU63_05810 [Ktedonobacterales bacterium]|nr:hypothetical protein [Ktedonobacterales bacterium]
MAVDRQGEQASRATPFACARLDETGKTESWRPMLRACALLTPLIEEHPARQAVVLALGGSERLLLGGQIPRSSPLFDAERIWPLLAEALTRRLAEVIPPGAGLAIGIGPTRTLAWLASMSSVRGQTITVVLPGQERAFLATLPVTAARMVPGAAEIASLAEMTAALDESGIRTLGQLQRLSADALIRRFGAEGATLAIVAAGGDPQPLQMRESEQWLGTRLNFEPPLAAQQLVVALAPLAEKLALTLAARGLAAGRVALLLESEAGRQLHAERKLGHPLATTRALLDVAERLLAGLLASTAMAGEADLPGEPAPMLPDALLPAEGERYVRLRLRLGGLRPATEKQWRLWAGEQYQAGAERAERLAAAVRALKGGRHADALLRADPHAPDAVLPEERYRMTRRLP